MSPFAVGLLLLGCFVAYGSCLHNATHPKNSTGHGLRSKCPASDHWNGTDVTSCSQQKCTGDKDCSRMGKRGLCCPTSCKGQNCFTSNVLHHMMKRSHGGPHKCPKTWNGTDCTKNMCSPRQPCKDGAMCCQTKCGKMNCYKEVKPREQREVEERKGGGGKGGGGKGGGGKGGKGDKGSKKGKGGKKGSSSCPKRWEGVKCKENMCKANEPCQDDGWCCPTRCGKVNCYKK